MSDEKDTSSSSRRTVSLGLNMLGGILFFTFIGYKIDQSRGGGQYFTLGGIFLGLLYCGYEVWKLVRSINM